MKSGRILMTQPNFERLERLVEQQSLRDSDALELLELKLSRAEVVDADRIPRSVVTMNSVVLFEDVETRSRRKLTLVYPNENAWMSESVSILAPVGVALIGQSAEDEVETSIPGRSRRLRVLSIVHQPETSGRALSPAA